MQRVFDIVFNSHVRSIVEEMHFAKIEVNSIYQSQIIFYLPLYINKYIHGYLRAQSQAFL